MTFILLLKLTQNTFQCFYMYIMLYDHKHSNILKEIFIKHSKLYHKKYKEIFIKHRNYRLTQHAPKLWKGRVFKSKCLYHEMP